MLFVVALAANWKTDRRNLLLGALSLFLVAGAVSGLYLEPAFADIKSVGYHDQIDPLLQARAAKWYAFDWSVWFIGLASGITLLAALVRPGVARVPPETR